MALGAQAIAGPSTLALQGHIAPVASRSRPRTSCTLHLFNNLTTDLLALLNLSATNLHNLQNLILGNSQLHKCSILGQCRCISSKQVFSMALPQLCKIPCSRASTTRSGRFAIQRTIQRRTTKNAFVPIKITIPADLVKSALSNKKQAT